MWFRADKTMIRVPTASGGITMDSGSASNKKMVSLYTDMITQQKVVFILESIYILFQQFQISYARIDPYI